MFDDTSGQIEVVTDPTVSAIHLEKGFSCHTLLLLNIP